MRARARGSRRREAHLAQRRARLYARAGGAQRTGLREAGERRAEPLFVIPRRGHVLPSPTGAPMGKLVAGAVLLFIAFSLLLTAATVRAQRPGPASNLLRVGGYVLGALAILLALGSTMVVIDPGEVGVRRAFGYVEPSPLLAGSGWSRPGRRSSATRRARSSGPRAASRSRRSRRSRASRWACMSRSRSAGRSTRCRRPRSSRRSATRTRSGGPC